MYSRMLVLIVIAGTLLLSTPTRAVVPSDSDIAQKVLACYRAAGSKSPTIQQMHDCSGVWVTPRALLMCALQATRCPVFSDTLTDRGTFYGELQAQKLNLTSQLVLPSGRDDLPPMPSKASIEACQKSEKQKGENAFRDCVLSTMAPSKFFELVSCFKSKGDADRANCLGKQAKNVAFSALLECVGNDRPTPNKLMECAAVPKLQTDAKDRRSCLAVAPTPDLARECYTSGLDASHAKLIQCLAKARTGADAAECLDVVTPDYQKARVTVACLRNPESSLVSCSGQVLSGGAKDIAACLATAKDPAGRFACATTVNPELPRAQKLSLCVTNNPKGAPLLNCVAPYLGGDAQTFVSCLSAPNANLTNCLTSINPKLKTANEAISCLASAKDADKTFGCLASQVGGDAAKIAGCVTKTDRSEMAVCVFGNKPEVRAAQAAYRCVSKANDTVSVIGYCGQVVPIDDKTREALTCVAHAGNDKSKLGECAATSVLPPEARSCGH
jgi:hypothetical protein